ncbi:MAG TPA: hypothetical protein IAB12_00975 [Candidatus Ornithospirochaeta avicola]|uniref:Uncharacterized protein n=1 Tax=Candidatus Ornithospirochaeta avicola TaxID=2840896 RepID=A0A9D1TMC0_9SPIO|nr:hypothetical protein [Candidatus Ornithospirochaeta avicola]
MRKVFVIILISLIFLSSIYSAEEPKRQSFVGIPVEFSADYPDVVAGFTKNNVTSTITPTFINYSIDNPLMFVYNTQNTRFETEGIFLVIQVFTPYAVDVSITGCPPLKNSSDDEINYYTENLTLPGESKFTGSNESVNDSNPIDIINESGTYTTPRVYSIYGKFYVNGTDVKYAAEYNTSITIKFSTEGN